MAYIRTKEIPPDSGNWYRYLVEYDKGKRHQTYLGAAEDRHDTHATKDEVPEKYHDKIDFDENGNITAEELCNSEYTKRHYQHAIKDANIEEWQTWSEETQQHFIPATGMLYDGWISRPDYAERAKGAKIEVVEMTPKEYQNIAQNSFDKYRSGGHFVPEEDNVKGLQGVIQEEKRLPMLSLDYTRGFDQEGRHRAMAAEREGIDKVPVVIAWDVEEGKPPEISEHVDGGV